MLYPNSDVPISYVASADGVIARDINVPVNVPPAFCKSNVDVPVNVPVTFPVNAPEKDVALITPFTSSVAVGVVVLIPTLASAPSKCINVVATPPSLIPICKSPSDVIFLITAVVPPVIANVKSLPAPTVIPSSLTIPNVPVEVSFAFDVKKFAKFMLPKASESSAVPANLSPVIAVESVIPFVTVAKPEIATFGVKVSS